VKEAGEKMPPFRTDGNWLWREYMQKAAIDKHTALAVGQQMALEKRIETRVAKGIETGELDAAIGEAQTWLDASLETPEMQVLRDEATRLGEESNALFGVLSEGIYNLDHDFIGLGWTRRQLERAKAAQVDQKRALLTMITDYENPGEGGFYDNCGTFESMPHLVNGYPYDFGQPYVPEMLSEANRHSQRTMCSTQDENKGVAFHYEGLDPNAHYRVRMTLVRPKYQARYAMRMNQKAESIYTDDMPLAKGLEVPEWMSDFFTFDIPPDCTKYISTQLRIHSEKILLDKTSWRSCNGLGFLNVTLIVLRCT
jgi:hypothetical protein